MNLSSGTEAFQYGSSRFNNVFISILEIKAVRFYSGLEFPSDYYQCALKPPEVTTVGPMFWLRLKCPVGFLKYTAGTFQVLNFSEVLKEA